MSSQSYGGEKSKTKLLAACALYEASRGGPFLNSLVLSIPWLVAASLQSLPLFTWLPPVAPGPHMAVFISYENTNRIGLESESESHSVVPDSLRPHGPYGRILQARILDWLAFPFSRGSSPTQGSNPGLTYCRQTLLAEPPGLLD